MKLGSYAADCGNGFRSICDYVSLRGENDRNLVAYTFLHDPDDKSSHQQITYGELLDRVISFSARLQQVAAPGDRAILLYPPGIDYIVAFYSCLWAGLAAVPAYPVKNNQHRDRLSAVISDCSASIILTHAADLAKLQETRSSSFPPSGSIRSFPKRSARNRVSQCSVCCKLFPRNWPSFNTPLARPVTRKGSWSPIRI